MKLGKEAKAKLDNDKAKLVLLQSLLDVATSKRSSHYAGIYCSTDLGYWFATDGFRVFAVSVAVLPGTQGKYLPKPFAESFTLDPMPQVQCPDIERVVPSRNPVKVIRMEIPGIVGAADDKDYSGHMTVNFENKGTFTYLGKLPEEMLAPDHIHFNMTNWNHLGGYTAEISYYGPREALLVRPNGSKSTPLESPWFSLIMPTRDPGEELIKMV
jgi:hypothetical protein